MVAWYDRATPQRFGHFDRISTAHGVASFVPADGNHQDVWPRNSGPLVEKLQRIALVDDDPGFDLKQESGGEHPRYVHRLPSIHRHQLRRTVRERETTVAPTEHESLAVTHLRQSGAANDGSVRFGNQPVGVPVVIRISVRDQNMGDGTPDIAWDDRSEAEKAGLDDMSDTT